MKVHLSDGNCLALIFIDVRDEDAVFDAISEGSIISEHVADFLLGLDDVCEVGTGGTFTPYVVVEARQRASIHDVVNRVRDKIVRFFETYTRSGDVSLRAAVDNSFSQHVEDLGLFLYYDWDLYFVHFMDEPANWYGHVQDVDRWFRARDVAGGLAWDEVDDPNA